MFYHDKSHIYMYQHHVYKTYFVSQPQYEAHYSHEEIQHNNHLTTL